MLTQLQLEGPELEPLLGRVRVELGPHARIVHAEKIRSGGVAGFFAHQRFELTVEVDTSLPRTLPKAPVAAPALPQPEPAPARPAPVVALPQPQPQPQPVRPAPAFAAITGLDEPEPSPSTAPAGRTAPGSTAPEHPLPARTAAAAAHAYAPQSASALVPEQREELPSVLAAALEDRPAAAPPPPRAPLRTPAAAIDAAPETFEPYPAFAGVADATTAPDVDLTSSVHDRAEQAGADAADAVVSTESTSFAALLSRLGNDIGALGDDLPGEVVPAVVPAAVTAAPAEPEAPAPEATDVVAVRAPAEVAVRDDAPAQGPADELARLGLPPHLRPRGVGEQLHTALRASLARLPTAPPAMNRAGSVLAVVGPLAQALHVAREIAEELGLPVATSVAVATAGCATLDVPERQVLHGAAEAAERRSTWRRRSNLTVVAVDAPLTANGAADARAFLAALSPTATWGVVEATRKAQDVGSWTRALGGVHALALTELEETSDPAAFLELGIPVSRLGGRPATPRAWATLLTGRLAA